MIQVDVPGYNIFRFKHLVLDYNGTLACDGELLDGVAQRLTELASQIEIHVVTADTFGSVNAALADVSCKVSVLPPGSQDASKLKYVKNLGLTATVCIGNGRNDRLMVKEAALGIVIPQEEGAAMETMLAADIVAPNILAALDLLSHPLRLVATLRS
jgi:soluble P-type ATPase